MFVWHGRCKRIHGIYLHFFHIADKSYQVSTLCACMQSGAAAGVAADSWRFFFDESQMQVHLETAIAVTNDVVYDDDDDDDNDDDNWH